MPSDDSTTPRPSRRPASSLRLQTSLPPLPLFDPHDIFALRLGGVIFLLVPSELAPDLLDVVEVIVNDPAADERYGVRQTGLLAALAEALSDVLAEAPSRSSVPEIHPEA